ncbi:fused signal recognition particle receptor [Jatrophihabitans sp. GAS493]|uniref:signal recognition particle-docking protein FtsY n=1 Tax=Jatrophihabitans sp. GAS493 TaxID=1907575 RepID=UPI000BB86D67|nr:fused signal recognition particle receptor [Jatrophihabitans sp. GAS493]
MVAVTYLWISLAIVLLAVVAVATFLAVRGRRGSAVPPPAPGVDYRPGVGDDAEEPRDAPKRSITTIANLPDLDVPTAPPATPVPAVPPVTAAPELDVPEETGGRLLRLRSRLARSQSSLGRGLLSVLSRENLDDDAWDEIEESLLMADVGVAATTEIVDHLKTRTKVLGTRSQGELRALLAEELVTALQPELDRSLKTTPHADRPAVLMVVGVNGTGKTTTCGKLARVLVADGRSVLLGAADTFRAAASEQLATWGDRVGARTVRGPEAADPASVAFDALKQGTEARVDTVLIDTAGRLHTKVGLMDELGKLKRVLERQAPVDETLLVLDATTGQNGLTQAKVFTEVVDVTGIVLTKLDGTAKGGIVISVQRALGVPVKLIGLGEGPDDLAPFDPEQFVDALLGETL